MLDETLSGLIRLKSSPDYKHLVDFTNLAIERARTMLENEQVANRIPVLQGEIYAYRGILKTFEDLEILAQLRSKRDNLSADPDQEN